jgi:hypothetical protein
VAQEKDEKGGEEIPVVGRAEGVSHLAEVDLPEGQVDEDDTEDNADSGSESLFNGLHLGIIPQSAAFSK